MNINDGNVKMEKLDNTLKITNLVENKISGIKFKITLQKFNIYTISLHGFKSCHKGHVELWITDQTYNTLLHTPYKLTDIDEKHIIKFNTGNNDDTYIGLLFMNCEINDYFNLNYMNIIDINNNFILKKNYSNLSTEENDIINYNKNIHHIIEQINTNLIEIDNKKAIIPIETLTHDYLNASNNNKDSEHIRDPNFDIQQGDIILFIVDFVYMKNNLADSRYKFIEYLESRNNNIVVTGTGRPNFKQGIHINRLVNMLKIKPKIIIHANNFLKKKLLVSGLREYPCKKALIIEDMHATDLIGIVLKYNRFNFGLYHCDCGQSDRLKLLNKQINFLNYPHFVDTSIYRNYNQKKTHDIILYGCTNSSVYPFRSRLFNLIRNCKRFKVLYIPFPGYNTPNKNMITHGKKLAQMINKSYIGISTGSIHNYFLKKYLEIPASYTMIAGDIPPRYKYILKGNIIELYPHMSDAKIINILQKALEDKQKLLEDTKYLHNLIVNNFSFEAGNNTFKQIIHNINETLC